MILKMLSYCGAAILAWAIIGSCCVVGLQMLQRGALAQRTEYIMYAPVRALEVASVVACRAIEGTVRTLSHPWEFVRGAISVMKAGDGPRDAKRGLGSNHIATLRLRPAPRRTKHHKQQLGSGDAEYILHLQQRNTGSGFLNYLSGRFLYASPQFFYLFSHGFQHRGRLCG